MLERRIAGVKGTYRLSAIIGALETHKEAHNIQYQKAVTGYRKEYLRRLHKIIDKLNSDGKIIPRMPIANLGLAIPEDKRKEYEQMIKLFRQIQATGKDEIILDMSEADGIFNNNWEFIQRASVSNIAYGGGPQRAEVFFNEVEIGVTFDETD